MKSEDYAWNAHERECYENGQVSLPSPYKLKILDESQKRLELEQILVQLPQLQLAQWAMQHATRFIALIDIGDDLKKQQILTQVQEVFEGRLAGNVSAYELRQAGFLAQKLSQQAKSPVSKYVCRACLCSSGCNSPHARSCYCRSGLCHQSQKLAESR